MDFRIILLLITSGANIGLSFFIFFKDFRNKSNIFFSLMLFSIALWSFLVALFYLATDLQSVQQASDPTYLAAVLIVFFFYYFTHYFPYEFQSKSRISHFLSFLFLFAITLIIVNMHIETIISFDAIDRNHSVMVNLLGYTFFVMYFVFYIIYAFYNLFKKLKKATAVHKKKIQIVLYSTLIAAVFGTIFNLALLKLSYKYIWLGPLFTLIVVFNIARYIFIKNE